MKIKESEKETLNANNKNSKKQDQRNGEKGIIKRIIKGNYPELIKISFQVERTHIVSDIVNENKPNPRWRIRTFKTKKTKI